MGALCLFRQRLRDPNEGDTDYVGLLRNVLGLQRRSRPLFDGLRPRSPDVGRSSHWFGGVGPDDVRCVLMECVDGMCRCPLLRWYLDIISFLFRRRWLIGSAAYLSNPEQTVMRSLTSLHHLWFLPAAMMALSAGKSRLFRSAFPLAMGIGVLSMVYGRVCVPKFVWFPLTEAVKQRLDRESTGCTVSDRESGPSFHCMVDGDCYLEYLNVNCGHEFFPEVSVGILHSFNEQPFYIYLPVVGSILIAMSSAPFALLQSVSDKYLL